jgi:hypothetical protein
VDPQVVIVAGFVTLAAGSLVLLSFGARFRVGRLIAATPETTVADARSIAEAGRSVYLRVRGRIDSEDAQHRPLVFRRTRIQVRRRGRWITVEDGREQVPFWIDEGLDSVAVDADLLDAGLVVVPRESTGHAADIADRIPTGTRPDVPARALIEQVASVEHAIVIGTPVRRPDGTIVMTAGRGRPLILTTLEPDEAMRVLTGGDRRRSLLAAGLLGAGLILVAGGLGAAAVETLL